MIDTWFRKESTSRTTDALSDDSGLKRSIDAVSLVALKIRAIISGNFSAAPHRPSPTVRYLLSISFLIAHTGFVLLSSVIPIRKPDRNPSQNHQITTT